MGVLRCGPLHVALVSRDSHIVQGLRIGPSGQFISIMQSQRPVAVVNSEEFEPSDAACARLLLHAMTYSRPP